MPDRRFGVPVFDADNHLYETRDALTLFLPDTHRHLIDYVERDGRTKLAVRGEISEFIPNPTFEVVGTPGAQQDYFKEGAPPGKTRTEILKPMRSIPAFFEPEARLALLDELGIDQAFMYPTLASLIEERFVDDPDGTHVLIHALNRWMSETWTFNYDDRMFPVPIITLPVVERAIEELEFVTSHGARQILIRPASVPGYNGRRSFALPEFDPFWRRVVELDVVVLLHASDSGYMRFINEWDGQDQEMLPFGDVSNFAMMSMKLHRPIEDAVLSLIGHGCLDRHPELRIVTVENGSDWVPPLLQHLDISYRRAPDRFAEHPHETFRRNIWIHPFHEEDPVGLVKLIGADRVCFGSDYPHVEGLSDPVAWVDEIAELPLEQVEMIMGGNLRALMGVAAPA